MQQVPWSEIYPGTIIQGKDGRPWTVVDNIDHQTGRKVVLSRDGTTVRATPSDGFASVLQLAPKPLGHISEADAVRSRWDAVDAKQARTDADRLDWIDSLPQDEQEAIRMIDRIFSGEWEDQLPGSKTFLVPNASVMTSDEFDAHCREFHGSLYLPVGHGIDHMKPHHGEGYINHIHDETEGLSRYELLREMADAGLLYATKQRTEAQTHKCVSQVFDEHPDALYLSRLAISGQRSGHEFCACNTCHVVRLMKPNPKSKCKMTPRCEGTMERIEPRPQRFKPRVQS